MSMCASAGGCACTDARGGGCDDEVCILMMKCACVAT